VAQPNESPFFSFAFIQQIIYVMMYKIIFDIIVYGTLTSKDCSGEVILGMMEIFVN
jgi:hypothetical protein